MTLFLQCVKECASQYEGHGMRWCLRSCDNVDCRTSLICIARIVCPAGKDVQIVFIQSPLLRPHQHCTFSQSSFPSGGAPLNASRFRASAVLGIHFKISDRSFTVPAGRHVPALGSGYRSVAPGPWPSASAAGHWAPALCTTLSHSPLFISILVLSWQEAACPDKIGDI